MPEGTYWVRKHKKNPNPDNTMQRQRTIAKRSACKAKNRLAAFILLGIDVHLNKYVVRRHVDGQGPQPAQTFRSIESLLKFMERQLSQAKAVYSCYEAGPLGYGLHRQIEALGITNYVVKPRVLDEEGKRRKNDKHDALGLVRDLERFVRGNEHALCVIRVPDLEQERLRSETRLRESWKKTRKRLESQGRGILLYYGFHFQGKWWQERTWKQVKASIYDWLAAMLEPLRAVILQVEERIAEATEAIEQRVEEPLPKGLGKLTSEVLEREIMDWKRFSNGKEVGSFTGMCPGEDSSGGRERKLSINKHGNPRVRHVLVEAGWRLLRYQPGYGPVKRFLKKFGVRGGSQKAARKKAVVAIGRQFIVDWWKIKTKRRRPEDLGLIMTTLES